MSEFYDSVIKYHKQSAKEHLYFTVLYKREGNIRKYTYICRWNTGRISQNHKHNEEQDGMKAWEWDEWNGGRCCDIVKYTFLYGSDFWNYANVSHV